MRHHTLMTGGNKVVGLVRIAAALLAASMLGTPAGAGAAIPEPDNIIHGSEKNILELKNAMW